MCQKPKSNVPGHAILVKDLGILYLVDEYKTIFFWKNRRNLGTLPKFSPYTGVSYNVVLKCVKGRNRIFWAIEYWCKTLECQIWSTIRKLFSWESETKLQILQKRSLYVGVSYKLFWSLSKAGIFWVIEYWLKALECQIWLTNTKKCFCES